MKSSLTDYLPAFIRRKIEANSHLHAVISNTGWMMGDKVIRMGVGLVVGVWITRYLGPVRYGELSYATAFAFLFSPIAMLGLEDIAIRRLVHDTSDRDEILGTVFSLMLLGGAAVLALATLTIILVRPGDTLTHWLVVIITAGSVFQSLLAIEFWFESQLKWKLTVYAKLSAYLAINTAKIVLVLCKAPLIAFAWAGLAEVAIGSAGLVVAYRMNGNSLKAWRVSRSLAGSLLKDSWPVMFSALLTVAYLKIDQIMLGSMTGNEELGFYSAAVRLTEIWNFIPIAVCSSVFPALAATLIKDEALFDERMQKIYNLMVFAAYAIAVPVTLLSDRIVLLLFNTAFARTGLLLSVLIWSGVFINLSIARNILTVSRNWLKVEVVSTLLGCLLNIVLNLFLIPAYGAMGAIVASLVSYWFAVHGTCFIFKPLRPTGWMLTKAIFYPKFW
jgi:O-antigen/teichoic acid export membrane protein